MDIIDQPVSAPQTGTAEQRAFRRQPIRLTAEVHCARGTTPHGCEIRDFCPGGMHLVYAAPGSLNALPTIGETVTITCEAPGAAGAIQFKARIVRTDGSAAGVALLRPRIEDLRVLQEAAREQQAAAAAQAAQERSAAGPDAATAAPIIDAYRRLVIDALAPMITAFMEAVDGRLFDLADHATSVVAEGAYFTAQRQLRRSDVQLRERFDSAVASRLYGWRAADPPGPAVQPAEVPIKLTLVADEDLEYWLAVSDVASDVEGRNAGVLNELERRLSHLHQRPVARDNNPVAPAVFAQAFQEALAPLGLDHAVNQVCFGVFKTTLQGHIADLYDGINRLLIARGVLPDIKPRILRQADSRRPGERSEPPAAAAPEAAAPENPTAPAAAPPAAVAGPMPGRGAPPRAHAAETAAHAADDRPTPRAGGTTAAAAPDGVVPQNLYQLVHDLEALYRAAPAGPPAAAAFAATSRAAVPRAAERPPVSMAPPPAGAVYATADVLQALTALQDRGAAADADAPGADLQARVLAELTACGGQAKQLAPRESGILDVAGRLFESLLHDMFVAHSVRAWLQRLQIPVLKRALQDETLFLDTGHVARGVLNRISQLELYGGGRDRAHAAVNGKIDALVDRIARDVDSDPEVFAKALKELDQLIQLQNDAYGDNLRDVIMQCEQEQARAEADGLADDGDPGPDDEWRRRARRLRVGSWLLQMRDGEEPLRIRLAWVSRDQDRFVFVNLRGQREAAYGLGELADRLRRGAAALLDNADEPAIDRAQYTMLQSLHRKLVHESTHDQLTGLINRREFERRLREAVAGPDGAGGPHTLCYLDVQKFGVINTACGYDAGDRLLAEVAGMLGDVLGGHAMLARIGGDEFAILFRHQPVQEALRHLQALMDIARDYRFSWQDKRYSVAFSVGAAPVEGSGQTPAALLQAAEASCRAAGRRGGHRVHVYDPDDAAGSDRHTIARWVSRIDRALDEAHVDLRYQRILPARAEDAAAPCHAEVLLAIADEEGREVSPQEFVVAAERYDRMAAVDRLVIARVFRWMAGHPAELRELGGLAVNLSGRSLGDPGFMDYVVEEARQTGAPLDKVCFEVTETAGVSNLSDAAEFILEMKGTGCRFSLDDFGSGWSSYAYLKNLPVDYLKIDGAFVKDMDRNAADFAVVKSITEIAHFMGKRVIAEYVQNAAALEKLRGIGVDYVQGYFIDRPRPLAD